MGLKNDRGEPVRAMVVGHNWRGSPNTLCIGAAGYNRESYVVVHVDDETFAACPVGTLFELVKVER